MIDKLKSMLGTSLDRVKEHFEEIRDGVYSSKEYLFLNISMLATPPPHISGFKTITEYEIKTDYNVEIEDDQIARLNCYFDTKYFNTILEAIKQELEGQILLFDIDPLSCGEAYWMETKELFIAIGKHGKISIMTIGKNNESNRNPF